MAYREMMSNDQRKHLHNMSDENVVVNVMLKTKKLYLSEDANDLEDRFIFDAIMEEALDRGLVIKSEMPISRITKYSIETDFVDLISNYIKEKVDEKVKEEMKKLTKEKCAEIIRDTILERW